MSHVLDLIKSKRLIYDVPQWRTPIISLYLKGLRKRDRLIRGATRTYTKIEVSLLIILPAIEIARARYAYDPLIAETVAIAMLLGLMFALRPGDYLYPHNTRYTESLNCLFADQFAFWFASLDDPVPITSTMDFPPGEMPTYLSMLGDDDKSHPLGNLGMRAIKAFTKTAENQHCSLSLFFAYCVKFPPQTDQPIFHTFPSNICLYTCVSEVLKLTAVQLGLPPWRVVPHGIRAGNIAQINSGNHSVADKMKATGHKSEAGLKAYERDSLDQADRVVEALNNPAPTSLAFLKFITTFAPTKIRGKPSATTKTRGKKPK